MSFPIWLFAVATLLYPVAGWALEPALPARIEFNRDVRPILSDKCFKCHGFDPKTREADRRLDTREGALAEQEGFRAVVPGRLAESDLHLRIHSREKDELMPPPKSGKKLTEREVALLDRWIEQGAEYQPHWAYAPLVRPAVPVRAAGGTAGVVRNPIDAFVLAHLDGVGLGLSAEADPATLARRVSFDLTGLPPKPELADQLSQVGGYDRLVKRLLASPAYGERMAVYWLDLVRYADTIGFHSDNPRNVSPYRDYVIRAFNENKPFNQFTIEQLAGDLLPAPTVWQRVASGYNRLTLTTEEGGAQPRDYEQRSVTDRVRSIGTTWLGQTTGCCQCHDHKFDPITTRDFYRLGAFFADIKEPATGRREEGMLVALPEQERQLQDLIGEVAARQAVLDAVTPELTAAQAAWEGQAAAGAKDNCTWTPLVPMELKGALGTTLTLEAEGAVRATGSPAGADTYRLTVKTSAPTVTGFRLQALASSQLPARGPGRAKNGNFVLSELSAELDGGGGLLFKNASATFAQKGYPATEAIDQKTGDRENGWAVQGGVGADQALYLELAKPLSGAGEKTIIFTLRFDYGDQHALGKFRLAATGDASPIVAPTVMLPPAITKILQTPRAERTAAQARELTVHFRSIEPSLAPQREALAAATKRRLDFESKLVRCLVTEAMPNPRVVRVLPRGDWQNESGEIVEPGVPGFLPQPAVAGRRLNRLDLAQWLVARENPLTARVFVNRLWKLFFGLGLSKVLDDFGAQGEPPLHGELLDWLAADFVESGWNVKHTVELIVTSATYRQRSAASAELQQRDPFNRELARQSRFRLDAEFVRDNALALSGLLVERVGGPSVKPYQPAGYWENLNFPVREWEPSRDENQWRRGLYTWWQRSYLQPSLAAFDAPSREECVAERVRSNIPQQALALLNDPTYVEAARAFAARILREGGAETVPRLTWALREALTRAPRPDELAALGALLEKHTALYAANPTAAAALLKTGFAPLPQDAQLAELAAWTSVARAILNLHETITRS